MHLMKQCVDLQRRTRRATPIFAPQVPGVLVITLYKSIFESSIWESAILSDEKLIWRHISISFFFFDGMGTHWARLIPMVGSCVPIPPRHKEQAWLIVQVADLLKPFAQVNLVRVTPLEFLGLKSSIFSRC